MEGDPDDSEPASPEHREVGSERAEEDGGLGSVVAHLYRGEVDRAVNWRTRLDSTTNWAVTIIAGILAYAFSSQDVSHAIILVAMLVGVMFLLIESRRFQRYDIWRSRVRSMQENLFADALDPSRGTERADWRKRLSEDYRHPDEKISFRKALAHRLRRVYLTVLSGLLLIWLFRLNQGDNSFPDAASVSGIPGWMVVGTVAVGYLCLLAVALWPNVSASTETD